MVQQFSLGGRTAWLKRYEPESWLRPALVRLWNRLAARLDLNALRSPPRRTGEEAKRIESRRIEALRACGAPVPRILGEGPRSLILSDMGPTLAHRLKRLPRANDADILVRQTAHAIGELHRHGGYLGQAFARNITVGEHGVGFIDFEEDPSEIMSLAQAQARDWVMFTTGISRYYVGRMDVLSGLIREEASGLAPQVVVEVHRIARKLSFLERTGRLFGRKLATTGAAIGAMRKGFAAMGANGVIVYV
ncbi:serine/threonine protein phosphatase [Luteibacter pinisoli]|uniref:Serine/threonine protein phosphatase n=1 Tax=Luteibacter pinisoli TaxID=2589080 RepID=A0A4Y5YXX4_9GAMM|nr:serine/threonine protein phosphatase [Luteibacter pinisoli]QDE37850.1 serine/threonine protein phosphatase [Luteibacter pinisoli]